MFRDQSYLTKATLGSNTVISEIDSAQDVLADIRKIIRASDIQSKRLQRATGLTTAQALALKKIDELGEVTTRTISDAIDLSQATVTTVLDRLEKNQLVERYRSQKDRRIVHAKLTKQGRQVLAGTPSLLDEKFIARFQQLPDRKRAQISSALAEVARMMDVGAIDTAPTVNGRQS